MEIESTEDGMNTQLSFSLIILVVGKSRSHSYHCVICFTPRRFNSHWRWSSFDHEIIQTKSKQSYREDPFLSMIGAFKWMRVQPIASLKLRLKWLRAIAKVSFIFMLLHAWCFTTKLLQDSTRESTIRPKPRSLGGGIYESGGYGFISTSAQLNSSPSSCLSVAIGKLLDKKGPTD